MYVHLHSLRVSSFSSLADIECKSYFSGIVIDQTVKDGFRVRNVDEISKLRIALANAAPAAALPGMMEDVEGRLYGRRHNASDEKRTSDGDSDEKGLRRSSTELIE